MKKSAFGILLFSLMFVTTSYTSQAQKLFRGSIAYTMSYSGTIDAATAAQQPKQLIVYVYDNLSKTTINMGPIVIDVIQNGDNKTTTTLLDIMGEKKYFTMTTQEIEDKIKEEPKVEIKYFEETKTIAGYVCKKAEMTSTDEDGTVSTTLVYYSEELGTEAGNYGSQYQGLKGMPMESVITTGEGGITTISATEVKKGKVKDTDFLIPADYTELSAAEKDEMLKAFQGE